MLTWTQQLLSMVSVCTARYRVDWERWRSDSRAWRYEIEGWFIRSTLWVLIVLY